MRVLLAAIVLLTGCGSIQVLQKSPTGGVVALHGDEDAARDKASEFMRKECPFGYRIVTEDDTFVGESNRELRIRYACKSAEGAPRAQTSEVAVRF